MRKAAAAAVVHDPPLITIAWYYYYFYYSKISTGMELSILITSTCRSSLGDNDLGAQNAFFCDVALLSRPNHYLTTPSPMLSENSSKILSLRQGGAT